MLWNSSTIVFHDLEPRLNLNGLERLFQGTKRLRNADCGMRAINFVSSLFISDREKITYEETEFEARNLNSEIRNRISRLLRE